MNQFDNGDVRAVVLVVYPIHDQATRFGGKRGDKQDGKGNGLGIGQAGDPMNTLTQGDRHAVAIVMEDDETDTGSDALRETGGGKGALMSEDVSLTIATGNDQTLFQPVAYDEFNDTLGDEVHHTLRSGTKQSTGVMVDNSKTHVVRRLTPVECERLQGFPDGWTDGQADSHRYKQMGNAVTVNVAAWVGKAIMDAETSDSTSS